MRRLRLEGKEAGFRGFRFQVLGGGGLAIETHGEGKRGGTCFMGNTAENKSDKWYNISGQRQVKGGNNAN